MKIALAVLGGGSLYENNSYLVRMNFHEYFSDSGNTNFSKQNEYSNDNAEFDYTEKSLSGRTTGATKVHM